MRKRKKDTGPDRPSKSQRKRDSLELQTLGEALIDLKPTELDALTLPETLRLAVRDAKEMHQRGALRRQKQYIGRLMRETDAEPIRKALARQQSADDIARQHFHRTEHWRDRILEQGEPAIEACLEELAIDDNTVRDLLAQHQHSGSEQARKTAARALFRHLHAACKKN